MDNSVEIKKGEIKHITFAKFEYAFRIDTSRLVSYIRVVGGPYKRKIITSCKPGNEKKTVLKALKRCSVW